jgi:hypothetical protein
LAQPCRQESAPTGISGSGASIRAFPKTARVTGLPSNQGLRKEFAARGKKSLIRGAIVAAGRCISPVFSAKTKRLTVRAAVF